ncbi:hypothetical protein [Streptomyces sp. SID12501]|uniref:Uncharacterized protein n=1 Tax=Streptomyces sp. SID12501 TaxID=2706042 RepID=A0A6B3BTT5_9ACTN|nr:hypothetical protein [Streptomyces sp. SID12501]NEC87763.1 hypothetical protein [Streptomyces sp. SID12501]
MKISIARGTTAAFSAIAILAGTASQVFATDATTTIAERSDHSANPAAYANYLRHSPQEGAADALKKFQHLTQAEQNKFIGYLHDPALLKSLLDKTADQGSQLTASSRNASSTTSLRNGDVTIGKERTISGLSAAAKKPLPSGNHTVKYNAYLKFFGITVIKLSLWVDFHSNGRDITKVNSANAGKKNLSGVINISKGVPQKSLSKWKWCKNGHCTEGHNADASVIWEGTIVFKGSTFQIDKEQWMRANVYGSLINYSLKNV